MGISDHEPGWGALLEGHTFDLADWQEMLKQPFDPYVVDTEHGLVLRSEAFSGVTNAEQFLQLAEPLIETLNGTVTVLSGGQNLTCTAVIEFSENGLHRHVFIKGVTLVGRSRGGAVGIAIGPDGQPLPIPPPNPTEAQRWAVLASNDEQFAQALVFFARSDNWFDIYKCLEALENRFGGERPLLARGWHDGNSVKIMKRTADTLHRHAPGKKPPERPTTLEEARLMLRVLLRSAAAELEGRA